MPIQMDPAMNENDIAVIGMSGRFPGAFDINELWSLIVSGREGVRRLTEDEMREAGVRTAAYQHASYQAVSGVLDAVDQFDAGFFGYSGAEAALIDPQQRLFLECAWHAMEDAGVVPGELEGDVGVFAGASTSTYLDTSKREGAAGIWADKFLASISNKADFLPARVSYKLNFTGPSVNIQTGCSTSLVAVHMACQSLLTGEVDMALAGGVAIRLPQHVGYHPQEGGVHSQDGHCRPFDYRSSGIVSGNGLAVVVLKRASDAVRDGDRIHALIRGSAVGNDGNNKAGFTAPSELGQVRTMRAALAFAGVEPESIGYIEAHGTATDLGDRIEVSALRSVYGTTHSSSEPCKLGSLKANLGHLDAAAGIAGLIKAILVLDRRVLPPVANFERVNDGLSLHEGRLYVDGKVQSWHKQGEPRRAAVNALGIGGTNAHLILEEAPTAHGTSEADDVDWHWFPVSANDIDGTSRICLAMAARLKGRTFALPTLSRELTRGRRHQAYRMVFMARRREELDALLQRHDEPDERILSVQKSSVDGAAVAFMFPGGGVNHTGMGLGLHQRDSHFREAIARCRAALASPYYKAMLDRAFGEAQDEPSETGHTCGGGSPTAESLLTLFCTEYALACCLVARGVTPDYLIGHSVGEYVAAVVACCMSLADGLRVVLARGELIDTLQPGRMLSVEASVEALRERGLAGSIDIAAINAPHLCTLSGSPADIEKAQALLERYGFAYWVVPLAVPAHSRWLDPILDGLRSVLLQIKLSPPATPIASNLTGAFLTAEQACSPDYWVQQFRQTVRFGEGLTAIRESAGQAIVFAEVGPGKTLSTFAMATPGVVAVPLMRHRNEAMEDTFALVRGIALLWQAGARMNAKALERNNVPWSGLPPLYPFARTRHWVEPKAGDGGKQDSLSMNEWFHVPGLKRAQAPRSLGSVSTTHRWINIGQAPYGLGSWPAGQAKAWDVLPTSFQLVPSQPVVVNAFIEKADLDVEDGQISSRLSQLCLRLKALLESFELQSHSDILINVILPAVLSGGDADPGCLIAEAFVAAVKTAAQEYQSLYLRLVDSDVESLESRDARCLLETRTSDRVLIWRKHQHWVPFIERVAMPAASPMPDGQVFVLIGGAGKIGRHLARKLASLRAARIALVTHRQMDETAQAALRQELGISADRFVVCKADVCDDLALDAALSTVEKQWGRIHAVLHLAAQTRQPSIRRLLSELRKEDCSAQFAPKIEGLRALDKVLESHPCDVCFVFSSNASIFGGIGQAAYAAANAFVDAFVLCRSRRVGPRWVSATWDGWRVDGEARSQQLSSLDYLALSAEDSFQVFERILAQVEFPNVIVSRASIQERVDRWLKLGFAASIAGEASSSPLADDCQSDVMPIASLEERLAQIWKTLLRLEKVEPDSNFFMQGGHSLLGLQLMAKIDAAFGVRIRFFNFSQHPTLANLTTLVRASIDALPSVKEIHCDAALPAQDTAPSRLVILDDLINNDL